MTFEGSLRFARSLAVTVRKIEYLPKVVSPVLSYSWIILSFGDYSTQHGRSSYGIASIRLSEFGGALDPDQSAVRLMRPWANGASSPRHSVGMYSNASSASGISLPVPSDDRLGIALSLAFAGGYVDADTWIVHGVMADAQTAALVLLWVWRLC